MRTRPALNGLRAYLCAISFDRTSTPRYVPLLPNGNKIDVLGINDKAIGHIDPAGGGPENAFGKCG